MGHQLDIVIPVYNEGGNILSTLRALARGMKTPARVLICYDFEEDDTLPAVRDNADAWSSLGYTLREQKNHAEAAQAFRRAAEGTKGRQVSYTFYSAAAQYALAERRDEAVEMLRKAFDTGFPNRQAVETDPDFASLRADPRVKEMVGNR